MIYSGLWGEAKWEGANDGCSKYSEWLLRSSKLLCNKMHRPLRGEKRTGSCSVQAKQIPLRGTGGCSGKGLMSTVG